MTAVDVIKSVDLFPQTRPEFVEKKQAGGVSTFHIVTFVGKA